MMKRFLPLLGLALLLVSFGAHAELSNDGLLTDIATRYQSAASLWATYIMGRATWLYWTLVTISLVWTGGMMLLRGAGLQEFFSEFVRFIMTTGFFWWLLMMAPTFVPGIYQSMSMIGASASGLSSELKPSGIVDIGFAILNAVLDNSTMWEPIDSLFGFLMALVILVVLALIAVNMVVLLISGWVVGYAGIIYLGFGGSRWTSDMAISFYKTVLAIGIQLMAMILLVGIGKTFMDDYYSRMAAGIELKETAVLMVAALVLLVLVNKVPQLISSIASSNVGMSGLGSYGSGTALAAAGVAGAAVGVGASMIAAGAANIAGGASAIKAAFSQGGANVASGTDVMAKMAGGAGGGAAGGGSDAGGGGGGGGAGTASSTPFAQAAGLDSQGGGASVTSIAGRSSSGGDSGGGGGSGGDAAAAGEAAAPASGGAASGNEGAAGGGGGGSPSSSVASEGEGGQAVAGASSAAPAASDGPMVSAGGGGSGAAAPSMASRAGAAMAKAARISADAGANLAMGAFDVGKQAVASRMEKFGERVSQTMGGKMADAITQRQESGRDAASESPTFSGDGITGAGVSMASAGAAAAAAAGEGEAKTAAPLDPEVAKFMQRDGSAG